MGKAFNFVVTFACMFALLLMVPKFFEEWSEAIESGKLKAREVDYARRIRTGLVGSGSNPVDVYDVPTPSE